MPRILLVVVVNYIFLSGEAFAAFRIPPWSHSVSSHLHLRDGIRMIDKIRCSWCCLLGLLLSLVFIVDLDSSGRTFKSTIVDTDQHQICRSLVFVADKLSTQGFVKPRKGMDGFATCMASGPLRLVKQMMMAPGQLLFKEWATRQMSLEGCMPVNPCAMSDLVAGQRLSF